MLQIVNVLKIIFYSFLSILRFLNILEPPTSGNIPGRDYFPIISWSKAARIVGLILVALMFFSGQPFDMEGLIAILTWVGGETAYRVRQFASKSQDETSDDSKPDNPDATP